MTESHTTRRFRETYARLPEEVRQQARQAFALFRVDPHHPSLRFKKIDEATNTYSVRVGLGYRALGVLEGSKIVWNWIGSHAEYDRLI
ncbi:MAG: type II toxin-antitoxin system RelE family toxin [Deltaproteobacteria bacterium]